MSDLHQIRKNRRWPIGICVFCGVFVLSSLILVIIASRQSFDLVETDYYDKGQNYQIHMEKKSRALLVDSAVTVNYMAQDRCLSISFSGLPDPDKIAGTVTLYRPSNSHWDRVYDIELDVNMAQSIDADSLVSGLWRIKIDWRTDSALYYYEQPIVVK
ncbi:MAG: FixH family protein [Planctomycetota bacterium]